MRRFFKPMPRRVARAMQGRRAACVSFIRNKNANLLFRTHCFCIHNKVRTEKMGQGFFFGSAMADTSHLSAVLPAATGPPISFTPVAIVAGLAAAAGLNRVLVDADTPGATQASQLLGFLIK